MVNIREIINCSKNHYLLSVSQRGKYRPRLLDLVRINTETSVVATSKKAFRKMHHQKNLSQAISALVTLKGIGPATASGNDIVVLHRLSLAED